MESTPIKIKYSKKDEAYKVVEGVVDLGYLGIYKTNNIDVMCEADEILETVFEADEDDEYDAKRYIPLKKYLREDMTEDEIAEGLSAFYNDRIADIQKHQNEINQTFLAYLLDDCCGCGYPFWEECSDFVDKTKMPDCDGDDIEDNIYTNEAVEACDKLFNASYETEHNGEVSEERPAEEIFKKYFPMFKLDKLLASIYGECLALDYTTVTFQCSGEGQALEIACGAYAEITINNAFYDWHNH